MSTRSAKRKPGRPAKMGEAMTLMGLRLPPDILRRVEAYAARLTAERPGSVVGISDAIRALLIEALDLHRIR